MTKFKSVFCLLLAAVMMLTPFSGAAFAEGPASGILLCGTDLEEGTYYCWNGSSVEPCGDIGDSYAVLSGGTLTLHNFRADYSASGSEMSLAGLYVADHFSGDLTIRLEGDNALNFSGSYSLSNGEQDTFHSYGINALSRDLTISGDGSLNVSSANVGYGSIRNESIAVAANRVGIADSASLNANAGDADYSCGIFASAGISLFGAGASVSADGSTSAFSAVPSSAVGGYEISVSSDSNSGLTGSGWASVSLAEPAQEPEYTEPEYTEPEYTEPEYTEPEYTEEYTEPEYTEPEVAYTPLFESEPEYTEPEIVYIQPESTETAPQTAQDFRYPGVMPDISLCYAVACTNENNNDGYLWFPEGELYEYRVGTEGDFIPMDGNGISGLVPGEYQVRLQETQFRLASEPTTFTIEPYANDIVFINPTDGQPAPEKIEDTRIPGVMPDVSSCYAAGCTNENNNDGYLWFPEGEQYEYRIGTEGDFTRLDGNGISYLVPGTYQVRLQETSEHLASEPVTFTILSYEEQLAAAQTAEQTEETDTEEIPAEESAAEQTVTEPSAPAEEPSPEQTVTEQPAKESDLFTGFFTGLFSTSGEEVQKTEEKTQEEPQTEQPSEAQGNPEGAQEAAENQPQIQAIDEEEATVIASIKTEELPQVSIGGNVEVDTGEAEKAADTLLGLEPEALGTEGEPEGPQELPKEETPKDIVFKANSKNSGYLTGSGLKAGQQYKVGETGTYMSISNLTTDGKLPLMNLSECSLFIINPGTKDTTLDSDPFEIQVLKAEAPTTENVIPTNATKENPELGTITFDAEGKYAYRVKDTSEDFKVVAARAINVPAGSYEICIPYSDNMLASESLYVVIKAWNAPNVTFTADSDSSGYVNDTDDTMQYMIGTSGEWKQITAKKVYFSNLSKGVVIQIRYAETGAATEIILDQQPTPTKEMVTVTGCTNSKNNNGTVELKTDDYALYELRDGSSGSFTPITAKKITGLASGSYQLRMKADGNKLASKLYKFTVDEYVPPKGIECQAITMLPYEKIFDTTDGYSTLTVTFYPYNTTNQTVTFSSSNRNVVNFGNQSTTTVGNDGTATIRMYPVGSGEATITAVTSNGKTATCHATVSFEYRFTYNKSGTWYYDRGGDYTVQTNGPMNRFSALKINGNTVNPQYYTTRANTDGTTILTISQYAMSCLNHGAYQKLQLIYNDGGVATTFLHIMSVNDRPITGDDSDPALWTALGLMSLIALGALTVVRRKKTGNS